jgi:hypothetical protein
MEGSIKLELVIPSFWGWLSRASRTLRMLVTSLLGDAPVRLPPAGLAGVGAPLQLASQVASSQAPSRPDQALAERVARLTTAVWRLSQALFLVTPR